ncbi:MAG: hypothetical protein V4596_00215 [Bdellovibrionota bacterium]
MKLFFVTTLTLLSFQANAKEITIANCSGEHHGTYVDVLTLENGKTVLRTSYDSDEGGQTYSITKAISYGSTIPTTDPNYEALVIKQAIADSLLGGEHEAGLLIVEAEGGKDKLILNINKYSGKNYLVNNHVVEEMTCVLAK